MKSWRITLSMLVVVVSLLMVNCESDNEGYISLSEDLELTATKSGDDVILDWTLTKLNGFVRYEVFRSLNPSDYTYSSNLDPIYSIDKYVSHVYTDLNTRFLGVSYYWIEVTTRDKENNFYTTIKSNLVSINMSDYLTINSFPISVIFDKENNLIGVGSDNRAFELLDYKNKTSKGKLTLPYDQCFPCFGYSGTALELYVPSSNGNIQIYNGNTLALKETLSITTDDVDFVSCAFNGNGTIYAKGRYNSYFYSKNRSSDLSSVIYTAYDNCHMQYCENTNSLVAIEDDSYPHVYYFPINTNGTFSTTTNYDYNYISGYCYRQVKANPYSNEVFVLPKPNLFNRSTSASVTTSYSKVQDIEFGSATVQYVAPFDSKVVRVYESGVFKRDISVPGYPVFVFVDDNELVVLFTDTASSYSATSNDRYYKGYSSSTPVGVAVISL